MSTPAEKQAGTNVEKPAVVNVKNDSNIRPIKPTPTSEDDKKLQAELVSTQEMEGIRREHMGESSSGR